MPILSGSHHQCRLESETAGGVAPTGILAEYAHQLRACVGDDEMDRRVHNGDRTDTSALPTFT